MFGINIKRGEQNAKPHLRANARNVKRRRQVLRQKVILAAALIVVAAGVLSVGVFRTEKETAAEIKGNGLEETVQKEETLQEGKTTQEEKTTQEKETEEKTPEELKEEEIALARASAQAAGAPQGILELLDKNEETVDFVNDYAEKKDVPPADTIAEKIEAGQIPYLVQWDERWGYQSYGTSTIAASGCGPTCVAMVVAGLTGDVTATPYKLAKYSEGKGYIDESGNTYWEFLSQAPLCWGISVRESARDDALIEQELMAGHPIICSVVPGDFTEIGHFIVLTEYDNGNVTVLDPFCIANTQKTWVYADIADQIKEIWVYAK